ncbi:MAG: hypothetical protein ACLQLH_03845 [Terracidiphilus sp.]
MTQTIPADSSLRQDCEAVRWKGRDAVRLANGIVELISLTGGGHLAVFRFLDGNDRSSQNVLWEAPWATLDPGHDWSPQMSLLYGTPETGKFIAGYTGHALCLDYFGEPSTEKAAAGLGIHGEAAISQWKVVGSAEPRGAQCRLAVSLPISRLKFEREIHLTNGQSVAYIQETVSNQRDHGHKFDWVQHVTFGNPFVSEGASTFAVSAQSGMTSPFGYEGSSLLPDNCFFRWPYVERGDGKKSVDLRLPFTKKGKSYLAGVRLDPERPREYLLAVNWKLRIGVGYCFRRRDFPWMAIWEENFTRQYAPWNGNTRARGMEFGTTPLPLAAIGGLAGKRFSNTPRGCSIAAHSKKTARYIMFLFAVPGKLRPIENVVPVGDAIHFYDANGTASLIVPADGCEEFLA